MTKAQEIQIKQSEVRERINELLGIATDDRTDEQATELRELTGKAQGLEVELRAALVLETPPTVDVDGNGRPTDPEVRERLELRGRATFGGFLAAALQGRLPAGAEHEYGAALGAQAGHVPMDLWEGRPDGCRDSPARRAGGDPGAGNGDRDHRGAGAAVRVRAVDRATVWAWTCPAWAAAGIQRADHHHGAPGGGEGEGRRTHRTRPAR